MGTRYTVQQFITAIPGTGGIITAIAKRVGCEWHTAKKWIYDHATVLAAYTDECERVLDMAETVVVKEIVDAQDVQTAKWYLTMKGSKRGYLQKHEVTGEDGGPFIVRVKGFDEV